LLRLLTAGFGTKLTMDDVRSLVRYRDQSGPDLLKVSPRAGGVERQSMVRLHNATHITVTKANGPHQAVWLIASLLSLSANGR
jgi:hypothetical protein